MTLETKTCVSGYKITRVKTDASECEVVGLGDSHVGSPHCMVDLFRSAIKEIERRGSLVVLMGDLLEMATRDSVGAGVYEQVVSPDDQITRVIEWLKPIRGKIIGAVKGNHEERSVKSVGIDPTARIMYALGLDHVYHGWEYHGIISGNGGAASIYAIHSHTPAKTSGKALDNIEAKLFPSVDADIIMKAHDHTNIGDFAYRRKIDSSNYNVRVDETAILCTGSFLSRPNSYAAGSAYSEKRSGTKVLQVNFAAKKHGKRYMRFEDLV